MKAFKVLSDDQLSALNSHIDTLTPTDGLATATGHAATKKKNLQILRTDPGFSEIAKYVQTAMVDTQVKAYTFFRKVLSPRVAIYREAGHYDWHVDAALMDHHRADLSVTIFLNDKTDYEGGHMEMVLPSGMKATVRGNKGEIVVYPSGLLHRVNSVTSGERRVIVGWINSNVRTQEHRERLYELNVERTRLEKKLGGDETENINRLYHQFVRDYSS